LIDLFIIYPPVINNAVLPNWSNINTNKIATAHTHKKIQCNNSQTTKITNKPHINYKKPK